MFDPMQPITHPNSFSPSISPPPLRTFPPPITSLPIGNSARCPTLTPAHPTCPTQLDPPHLIWLFALHLSLLHPFPPLFPTLYPTLTLPRPWLQLGWARCPVVPSDKWELSHSGFVLAARSAGSGWRCKKSWWAFAELQSPEMKMRKEGEMWDWRREGRKKWLKRRGRNWGKYRNGLNMTFFSPGNWGSYSKTSY